VCLTKCSSLACSFVDQTSGRSGDGTDKPVHPTPGTIEESSVPGGQTVKIAIG
jgi:hypothetical protein